MAMLTLSLALLLLVDAGLCRVAAGGGSVTQEDIELERYGYNSAGNASDIAPDKFITGGRPTGLTQYPWLVYLFVKETATYGTTCGGSLISPRHVLTAAHCMDHRIRSYDDVNIYLGEYNTRTFPNDCVGSQCVQNLLMHPDKITVHHQYQPPGFHNDIAMLRLRQAARNIANIHPIRLPSSNINDGRYEGTLLTITGWGKTEHGQQSAIKLHAQVQLIAPNTCRRYAPVSQGMLCAASRNGQDMCFGDSGGPIMSEQGGNYYLNGIVSYRISDCGSSVPSMYTNVFSYLDWIQSAMRDLRYPNNRFQ